MSDQAGKTKQSTATSEKLAALKEACRKAGLKVTHQRIEVFRELASSTNHPSAEAIYRGLLERLPTISLDTVYRTLATFEKHRLITRIQTPESLARFEVEMDKHHHIVCSQCGRVTDFSWNAFDESQLPQNISRWGMIDRKNVTLQGICKECSP
jgi:Fur family peroxide stress response transcriptional regulator